MEFSVQMNDKNPFERKEADKTIDNTINRDCKMGGGYIVFSANFAARQRWVLNASRRGSYRVEGALVNKVKGLRPQRISPF